MANGSYRGAHPLAMGRNEVNSPNSTYPRFREDAFALGHLVNGPSLTNFVPEDQRGNFAFASLYDTNTHGLFIGPDRFRRFRTQLLRFLRGGKFQF